MNAYGRDSLLNINFVNEADILDSLTLKPEGNGVFFLEKYVYSTSDLLQSRKRTMQIRAKMGV